MLRTTTNDKSTTDGNIKVAWNGYLEQLGFGLHDLDNQAIPCINDQSTNSRVCGAQLLCSDNIRSINHMENFQLAPSFFHVQLNLIWAILHVHCGSIEDTGGMQYYISLLGRVRLGAEHPDYRTLVSFTMQVLVGNTLLYWETVSKTCLTALAEAKPTFREMKSLTTNIYHTYVSSSAPHQISGVDSESEDSILCNIILLNHDLLIFYKLDLTISSGDFGRVEIFLSTLIMIFAGAGCKNYTMELLHFIQNLKKNWTSEFA
ncbi:hypothetical protein DFH29DRAFT_818237 [Suillus ampliporus]|nr:hypothetical protein DFH29DRAFT_818237 [Suillus ampliporus]